MTEIYREEYERMFREWVRNLKREEYPPKWRKEKAKKIYTPFIKCSYFRRG